MALNPSLGSIFSTCPSLEQSLSTSLCSSDGFFMDRDQDKNLGCNFDSNLDKNPLCNGMGKSESGGLGEPVNDDILSRLPVDPFGMDIRSTFTTIMGWFEGFEKGFQSARSCSSVDDAEEKIDDSDVFAGLSLGALRIETEGSDLNFDDNSITHDEDNDYGVVNNSFFDVDLVLDLVSSVEEFLSFSQVTSQAFNDGANELRDCSLMNSRDQGGAPHDAMAFALRLLGVNDLLSVERVCRSLRRDVRSDNLLWRNIVIDWPLSDKLTDDALLKLTARAEGTVECLSLQQCMKITDGGLKRVLERNPNMKMLSVLGCSRISAEGLLYNLRAIKSAGNLGIKHLRVCGISHLTNKHYEELKFLLDADTGMQLITNKPRIYRGKPSHLLFFDDDDGRAIDVEPCPKCQNPRLVFDCPESCQEKHQYAQLFRGCLLCIARCFHCGCCIKECEYVETFGLDLLCIDCFKHCSETRVFVLNAPLFIKRRGTDLAFSAKFEDIGLPEGKRKRK